MSNIPTIGVFVPGSGFLNDQNVSTNQFGAGDAYGNQYPTGLTNGKVIEIGDALALNMSKTATGTLYGGAYQWVQVDSAATAGEVAVGLAAFCKFNSTTSDVIAVTGESGAAAKSDYAGVFLNTVTPGNWCFIFVGAGRVVAKFKGTLTNAGAIGDNISVGGGAGTFDDTSATAVTNLSVGNAVVAPTNGGSSIIYIRNLIARVPAV